MYLSGIRQDYLVKISRPQDIKRRKKKKKKEVEKKKSMLEELARLIHVIM